MTGPYRTEVYRLPMRGPGDTSALAALLGERLDPRHIVAILGKTEGNGGVNDFTREFAHRVYTDLLERALGCPRAEVDARVAIVMSGGTEGVLSPHVTVFARVPLADFIPVTKRLAVGVATTRTFLPEDLGRGAQIVETAEAVKRARIDAGIGRAGDVHFVQIKCPLLTAERIGEAKSRGQTTVTEDPYKSMGYSRGASAIGVGLVLGEISGPGRG